MVHTTKGPWQVNEKSFQVCDSDGEKRGCSAIATMHGTRSERIANGNLIAAAPDLLEALEALMNSPAKNFAAYTRFAISNETLLMIESSLKKAKGEV